jgi:hypothetical protein
MTRILLQYLLPLLLPAAIYLAWAWFSRARHPAGALPGRLRDGPWFWLIFAGVALAAAGLVFTALIGGEAPGETYQAPRWEDGGIVPGRVE